jgi:hypothetical protein
MLKSSILFFCFTGRSFLAGIVKAISTGCVDKAPPKAPVIDVVRWLSSLFDLVKDIVTGSYTDDIEFVMNGEHLPSRSSFHLTFNLDIHPSLA